MDNRLVSIIVPCFNAEKYVGEAIQSALDQTYPNTEVIVIDDGSTDGSLDVIRSFGDRVHYETGPNRGACAARNRGIEMAEGEFIQFLDADDVLYREKLARQLAIIGSTSADIVFCAWTVRSLDVHDVELYCRPMKGEDAVVYVLTGRLQTAAPLHRKSLLQEVGGFRADLPCAQEFDLHLRMAAAGYSFRHHPEPLLQVRTHRDSVSNDYERVLDQYRKILPPVFGQIDARGAMTEERRRAFAGLMGNGARIYMRMGQRAKGEDYFRRAKTMYPDVDRVVYNWPARFLKVIAGPYYVEKFVMFKRSLLAPRADL